MKHLRNAATVALAAILAFFFGSLLSGCGDSGTSEGGVPWWVVLLREAVVPIAFTIITPLSILFVRYIQRKLKLSESKRVEELVRLGVYFVEDEATRRLEQRGEAMGSEAKLELALSTVMKWAAMSGISSWPKKELISLVEGALSREKQAFTAPADTDPFAGISVQKAPEDPAPPPAPTTE